MATNNTSNTVTINGKAYNLNAKIAVANTARLGVNNLYIANSIYGIATVGNIVNATLYPNANITNNISRKVLAKAGVTLNSKVFTKGGLRYFLNAGNITITA